MTDRQIDRVDKPAQKLKLWAYAVNPAQSG
jgi:hypothetical protein